VKINLQFWDSLAPLIARLGHQGNPNEDSQNRSNAIPILLLWGGVAIATLVVASVGFERPFRIAFVLLLLLVLGFYSRYRQKTIQTQQDGEDQLRTTLEDQLEKCKTDLVNAHKQLQQAIVREEQAEKALWENQHFIQRIADAIPSMLYVYDLHEQRTIYTNYEIADMLGYTQEAISRMGDDWFRTLMHPDDADHFSTHLDQFNTAKEGDIFEREYRMKATHGEWRWFMSRDTLFTRHEDGTPEQILGTATEITERKRAEEALQQANCQLTAWVNELELRTQEQALMAEMSDFLQVCLTVEEAYGAIADLIQPLFPDCSGAVFITNESCTLAEAVAIWGNALSSQTLFDLQDCWALRRGRPHWAEKRHMNLFCKHLLPDASTAESLCTPMMAQGQALGLLYLVSAAPDRLPTAKQQLAVTVAEHLALALANLKLRQTLHTQSIRDPLTGLFNRRYLEDALEQSIHQARRQQQPLGIVMVDIDYFKRFNDTFGHEAGDLVLRALGQFLQTNIRRSDVACRYGGEELLVILPDASLEHSRERAEQLRKGAKCLDVFYEDQPLKITISLGVACFPNHGQTREELIRAADSALYRAKATGRDCTIVHSDPL